MQWKEKRVSVDMVIERIRPGTRVFLTTGAAEPRTLVKRLMAAHHANLQDLELIQIVSLADAIPLKNLQGLKFRLKTFFSGWVADEAIAAGHVELIPCCLSRIPELLETQKIRVDTVFVQITPPDKDGYSSLGVSVDVARMAMEQADPVVGEINSRIPRTLGDTFVHISEFDMLVHSDLFNLLIGLAQERNLKGFWADVLGSNFAMLKVFKNCALPVQMELDDGVYHVRIPFGPSDR